MYGPENIRFWRTAAHNEIDFILVDGLNPAKAIEVKFSNTSRKANSTKLFAKSYPMADLKLIAYQSEDPGSSLFRK
jgi:predicted AAA+ superfamily ATPase